MTALFLAALAMVWITLLLPATVRAWHRSPLSTAERFKRRLDLLAPRYGDGRWVLVPQSHQRLARRSFAKGQRLRRRIFLFLLAAAAVSLPMAVVAGGPLWKLNVALDASLAGYVVLLLDAKRRRRRKRGLAPFARPGSAADEQWHDPAPFEVRHI